MKQETDPLPDTRPYTLAAAFLRARDYADVKWIGDARGYEQVQSIGVTRLRHWREEFYVFRTCVYQRVVLEELMSELTMFLNQATYFSGPNNEARHLRVTRGVEGDVLQQLRRICQVASPSMPVWIDPAERPEPKDVIAFQNGLLDIREWLTNPDDVQLENSTHEWFSESVLPCAFDPLATCPRWQTFLDEALAGDVELIALLQEFFGYCLTGDTSRQKMLWLHGVSRGGKGTVTSILQDVIGEKNCVSFDLWGLLGTFSLWPFLHKRLAVSGDAHLGNSHEAEKVLAKLKGITGEDRQSVDRKNREILPNVLLTVRFVISTNEFPNLPDASDALATRALFIPFNKTFKGQENIRLKSQLRSELAGITVWALRGLRRLLEKDGFSEARASEEVSREFKRLQSPVHAFVEDCCEVRAFQQRHQGNPAKGSVDCGLIYKAFRNWMEANGRGRLSQQKFGERLRRAVPDVVRVRPADSDGGRFWEYRGIQLKEWAQDEYVTQFNNFQETQNRLSYMS